MSNIGRIKLIVFSAALAVIVVAGLVYSTALASEFSDQTYPLDEFAVIQYKTATRTVVERSSLALMAQQANGLPTTTLSISNLSTIWAPVDKQNPDLGPRVFVVEAEVSNVGAEPAQMVQLYLDYNEDPASGWVLLPGEYPTRTISTLGPGESAIAYWFVSYPELEDQEHEYFVSAMAQNAALVSTNESVYDIPSVLETVKTLDVQRTGNNGQVLTNVDVVVGVAYTVTVIYELGNNVDEAIFSPVGNVDFDPSSTRLLSSTISFQNFDGSQRTDVDDRLYFPSLPQLPNGNAPTWAVATYQMIALKQAETRLCAYTVVQNNSYKYDKDFCEDQTVILISGTSSFSLTKSVDRTTIQQNQTITYALNYTNGGDIGLQSVWIWDELDPVLGQIIAHTTNPAPDPSISNESLVAWNLDNIPAAGQPGSSGLLTLTVQIDGGGQPLTDGMAVVNTANFGIEPGGLPTVSAISSTVTGTLQAPDISLSKSDGLNTIGPGDRLTYTLVAQNSGSAVATNLVITDSLPSGVVLAGDPTPVPDSVVNNTLWWNASTLGNLSANGGSLTITVPVSVDPDLNNGTLLTNQVELGYQNSADFVYPPETAQDTTVVERPFAIVDGYAFEDSNGDGQMTAGEAGLSDVQINLPSAVDPLIMTDGNGYYRFTIEDELPISVTNTIPLGYFRTTPGLVFLDSTFGVTQTVNFGFAPDSADFGVIYGTVFEDSNQNGIRELGEKGFSDVNISSAEAMTTPLQSDSYGRYTLRYNTSLTTTVSETNPLGFVSTTPDNVTTNVSTGSDSGSPIDFGDTRGIKITGMVFEDSDVDGTNNGESGLAGAVVEAGGVSYTTGASGVYTLYVSPSMSPITITETNPDGYISTNAIPVSGTSKIDVDSLLILDPMTSSVFIGDFGDVAANEAITVTGMVWDDNGSGGGGIANGVKDGTEPGLGNALITLSSGTSQLTDVDGNFALRAPAGQVITVTETNPSGYISTNAIAGSGGSKVDNDTILINPAVGGSTIANNLFGDVRIDIVNCEPDGYEDDDLYTLANNLSFGQNQTHDFCDDAVDWLTFSVQAGRNYTITTSSGGDRADTYLALFDDDGQSLLAANDDMESSTDYSSQLRWQATKSGEVYIRVTNMAQLEGLHTQYQIWSEEEQLQVLFLPFISVKGSFQSASGQSILASMVDTDINQTKLFEPNSPLGVIVHSCPDSYEADDTWQLAKPIQFGSMQWHTFDSDPFLYAVDKDYSSFELQSGQDISFTVTTNLGVEILLEVYDRDGYSLGLTGTDSLLVSNLPSGQYYLSASPAEPTYSCEDGMGYELLAAQEELQWILLPAMIK